MKQANQGASVLTVCESFISPISVRHGTYSACKLLSSVIGCRSFYVWQLELALMQPTQSLHSQPVSLLARQRKLASVEGASGAIFAASRKLVRSNLHNGRLHAARACCMTKLFACQPLVLREPFCLPTFDAAQRNMPHGKGLLHVASA